MVLTYAQEVSRLAKDFFQNDPTVHALTKFYDQNESSSLLQFVNSSHNPRAVGVGVVVVSV